MVTVSPHSSETEKPARKSNLPWLILLIVAFAAGLGTGYAAWGSQPSVQAAAPGGSQATAAPAGVQRIDVPIEGKPMFGPANAPVTIVEFSDFECPYCKQWFTATWPQIKKAYGDKVRLVYRDFPLTSIHPDAEPAAEAANCANEQNQYWAYHDNLLAASQLGSDVYLSFASALKLDMTKFQDCLSSHRYQKSIQADADYGASLGITGTPTFFVNGIPMVGAQPFSVFKSVIDQELASIK